MTRDEIAAAEARCQAATPEPWHLTKDRQSIIQTKHITRDVWTIPHRDADMDFIAAARTDLPAALAQAKAYLTLRERVEATLANWQQNAEATPYTVSTPMLRACIRELRALLTEGSEVKS